MAKKIQRSNEGVRSGKRLEYVAVLTFLSLVSLSMRSNITLVFGIFLSLFAIALVFYNYHALKSGFLKLRAKYAMLTVVLAVVGYYAAYSIPRGDVTLIVELTTALVTATSISAVFAVNMYEKISSITVRNKHRLSKEILDINIRLATYPILISVGAVFASILALIVANTHFTFSIFLINVTVTSVLLTLITSVALLKEDLLRQLAS